MNAWFPALPRVLRTLRGVLAGGALAFLACDGLQASPFGDSLKSAPGAPPIPAPLLYTVNGRDAVRLPLKIVGTPTGSITFILRSQPQHGIVRMIRAQGEAAMVEYTPPSDRSISSDSFSFVAANSKGVSSEALVQIKLVDRSAKLEAVAKLDFPSVRVGEKTSLTLEIYNAGDLAGTGAIRVPAPWMVQEIDGEWRIPPRQKEIISINFSPILPGEFSGEIRFDADPSKSIALTGRALDWLDAGPDPLPLSIKDTSIRSGKLHLANPGDTPLTVNLSSTPPLDHPAEVTLAPHEQTDILVRRMSRNPAAQSGILTLTGSGKVESKALVWEAAALLPRLGGLESVRAPLQLTRETGGKPAELTLKNEGGQPGTWTLECPDAVALRLNGGTSTTRQTLHLAPEEVACISLFLSNDSTAPNLGVLKIQGADGVQELALGTAPASVTEPVLPIISPPKTVPKTPRPSPAKSATSPASPPDIAPQKSLIQPPTHSETHVIPTDPATLYTMSQAFAQGAVIPGLSIGKITATSAVLTFPLAATIPENQLRIHYRTINTTPDGTLQIDWEERAKIAVFRESGDKVVLTLNGLLPGKLNTIRLLGPDLGNGSRLIMHQCDIETPEAKSWVSVLGLGFGIILVLSVFWIRSKQKR
jgi:hypothetical protein